VVRRNLGALPVLAPGLTLPPHHLLDHALFLLYGRSRLRAPVANTIEYLEERIPGTAAIGSKVLFSDSG